MENSVSFTVDAGLINRLGVELVGRAETAVSELVKNSYDADATEVSLEFINTDQEGGTLIIQDNGLGMNIDELVDGFMRISSTKKLEEPRSPKFDRIRAGKKGIGRFATQRLGKTLIIETKSSYSEKAYRLTIAWDQYKVNQDIGAIKNPIDEISNLSRNGTKFIIQDLRDPWTEATIKRVFRYISDLLQPDFLGEKSRELNKSKESSFDVKFFKTINGQTNTIASVDKLVFDKAVAVIEGYVDDSHDGYCMLNSSRFNIEDDLIPISSKTQKVSDEYVSYEKLKDIHFKVYYFIYNRPDYYVGLTKSELNTIQKLSKEHSGVRLYRNGFRVLPYGEPSDDWLKIDSVGPNRTRLDGLKVSNAPFSNKNFFGFVEITDFHTGLFDETASREGLIQGKEYEELTDFLLKSLLAARARVASAIKQHLEKQDLDDDNHSKSSGNELVKEKTLDELTDEVKDSIFNMIGAFGGETSEYQDEALEEIIEKINYLKKRVSNKVEEIEMLRVLAGMGLIIGEFVHEIRQFNPQFGGDIKYLLNQDLEKGIIDVVKSLDDTFKSFKVYTGFFDSSISQNVKRELQNLYLRDIISEFERVIVPDLEKTGINFQKDVKGMDLLMSLTHPSEWKSVLFNLYTNSKKAIKRKGVSDGKILIVGGRSEEMIFLEFHDNGDGIPNENIRRVFNPFFTTSTPAGFDSEEDDELVGTGLGLKIVKDIIESRNGQIVVAEPKDGFSTCFRITIPAVNS